MTAEWLGIIVSLAVGILSAIMTWKSNKTLETIKLFEFKHAVYVEVLDELSKADVGLNCDYVRLVAACYKARLFLPESVGQDLMRVAAKVRIRQSTLKNLSSSHSSKDYARINRLNEEIEQLVNAAIESMANSINRHDGIAKQ